MALSIHIRFLTGRAHLHPWQAHPSEGQVEWPPSPWRLLRALVAVAGRGLTTFPKPDAESFGPDWFKPKDSKSKGKKATDDTFWSNHKDALPLDELAGLLRALSKQPPVVWLPRTAIGHTRHFFPTTSGKSTGSAVFDTFAAFDAEQSLVFEWQELSADNLQPLERLLARMLYFGRAESWCEASLQLVGFAPGGTHWACVAVDEEASFATHFKDQREHRDYYIARRLGWDETQMDFLKERFPKAKSVSPAEFLLRCLLRSSGESAREGDRPWGTRWLHYAVPNEVFRLPTRKTRHRSLNESATPRPQSAFQVIRYALNTATVHRAVLPPVTAILAIGQRCRAAAMSIFGMQNSDLCSPQLTGRRLPSDAHHLFTDIDGAVKFDEKNGSHAAHAYYWPMDEDGDGFLDHILIYCDGGFSAADMAALRSLTRISQRGNREDLLLTPVFEGRMEELFARAAQRKVQPAARTKCFVSATPYFCPLHLTSGKSGGRNRPKLGAIVRESVTQVPGFADATIQNLDEIVFDYDPASLATVGERSDDPRRLLVQHLQRDTVDAAGNVVAPAGAMVAATLDAMPSTIDETLPNTRYPNACVRNPDAKPSIGLTRGLFASHPKRFIPALAFARTRTSGSVIKGHGVMLRIVFHSEQSDQPFAIGAGAHFGLGLFVPVDSE